MRDSVTETCPAPHRLADEVRLRDIEMLKQRVQIAGECRAPRPVARLPRLAECAMVDRYAAMAIGEKRDLLPPAQMIAAAAVREHDRRTAAVAFIIELDSVDCCERHHASPIN